MKTGLITFHYAHHYGAQLQAYALTRSVRNIGADCEIINYVLPHTEKSSRLFQGGFSSIPKNLHTLAFLSPLTRRSRRFHGFIDKHMNVGTKRYSCFQDLLNDPPQYDAYLCGSDQIWNPFIFENRKFDPSFFLSFAAGKPLVSYAPSFGAASIPDDMRGELAGYLSKFAHISAREKRGADIIKDVAGLDVPVTLDPTLLLDGRDWIALARAPKQREPYTLCYFVSDPGRLSPLAAEMGRKVVQLAGTRRRVKGADELVLDAGPEEFLGLYQNADFVLTNSFHGAVFSILFNKPFICGAGGGEEKRGSRIGNLLDTLGLSSRFETDTSPIDYTEVNRRLEIERDKSLGFLKNALGLH